MGVRATILTALAVFIMATVCSVQADDQLTISAYYPSPYGVYKSLRLTPTSAPTTGVAASGVMFYNSSDNKIYYHDNTNFTELGAGTAGVDPYWSVNASQQIVFNVTTDFWAPLAWDGGWGYAWGWGELFLYDYSGEGELVAAGSGGNLSTNGVSAFSGFIFEDIPFNDASNIWQLLFLDNSYSGAREYLDSALAFRRIRYDGLSFIPLLINSTNGYIGIGNTADTYGFEPQYNLHVNGTFAARIKNFEIVHPLNPKKRLVHSALEGPEQAVLYRGTARLVNNRAEVVLPPYFEALTRKDGRTILLAPVNGFAALYVEREIKDGRFVVRCAFADTQVKEFYWEVKAVRADVPALVAEK